LYEQIRILQDENERLETENKQVRTNYEMLGFVHEDLKAEMTDKDEEMQKADYQVIFFKNSFHLTNYQVGYFERRIYKDAKRS